MYWLDNMSRYSTEQVVAGDVRATGAGTAGDVSVVPATCYFCRKLDYNTYMYLGCNTFNYYKAESCQFPRVSRLTCLDICLSLRSIAWLLFFTCNMQRMINPGFIAIMVKASKWSCCSWEGLVGGSGERGWRARVSVAGSEG